MPGVAAFVLSFATIAGLAAWVPEPVAGRNSPGMRFLGGGCLLLVGLFLLHLGAGLGLTSSARIMAGLALLGAVRLGWAARGFAPRLLLHPAPLLSLLILGVLILGGGTTYQAVAWDEVNNYLSWARQGFVADRMMDPSFFNGIMGIGFIPGWAMLMDYPGLILGRFAEGDGLGPMTALHLGMLAALFDVVVVLLLRRHAKPSESDRAGAALAGWLLVLGLLAAEASWKLVPTHLWVEKPQIYLGIALLVLPLAGLRPLAGSWLLGLILAAGITIKVAMGAMIPSALLVLVVMARLEEGSWRPAAARLARSLPLLLAALVVVEWAWSPHVVAGSCYSNPLGMLAGLFDGGAGQDRALDLGRRYGKAVADYALAYKLPLTLASAALLAAAAARSRSWLAVTAAFLGWAAVYFGSLYLFHLFCFGEWYFQNLNSIDRFTRMPLRMLHVLGPVAALAVFAPMRLPLRPVLVALALVLGGWQLRQAAASFREVEQRIQQGPEQMELVTRVRAEAAGLRRILPALPAPSGPVLLIVQGGLGYEWVLAHYDFIGRDRGAAVQEVEVPPRWAFAPATPDDEIRRELLGARALWPMALDARITGLLAGLIDDSACRAEPQRYFLAADSGRTRLVCFHK